VRTHIRPERILECPTASCPFVTEYRHHLELHLRNHLNSRPIRCPICPYRCAVSSMLASHLKSHTKVHRFRCSVCRFSSKFSNALKRHLLEKGHGRGYVLNPDGSIPEGGAVPFEPGSPTTRLRQKVTATTKTASATTATATSEALRKPTRSVDVTSEVALVTGTDIKASIWTPPVATSTDLHGADARMANWRSVATGEEQLVKCSPSVVGTSPVTVAQPPLPPLPPLPALMTSTSASLRARPLYVCAVCGLDAGGYVGLAQHMMTSHYSVMTSGSERQAPAAATMPFKRRWPGDNDEPGITSWTPPPKLPTPQLNNPARRPVSRPDDKREFLQPGFQASSTFHQPSPPVGWGSYRSVPAVSSALSSLSELRAELDAVRSLDGPSRARAEETFRTPDHDLQRDNRVKSAKFDVVDSPRWTDAPPRNVADGNTSPHWQKTQPSNYYVEHAPAPMSVTSGLPLDLSAKTSTLRCDQLLASVQSEVKRSRRKGKAFKVDADRLNSGSRDEDLNDSESVGRYSSATETKVSWRTSEIPDTATSERVRSSGGNMLAGRGLHFTGYRDIPLPSQARSGQSQWSGLGRDGSDVTASRQTTPVSVEAPGTSSTQYHECRHCGLGFRDGELYAMHMDFHGRPDPFTCNFCGTSTGNQVEFFLHVAHAPHNVRPVYVV